MILYAEDGGSSRKYSESLTLEILLALEDASCDIDSERFGVFRRKTLHDAGGTFDTIGKSSVVAAAILGKADARKAITKNRVSFRHRSLLSSTSTGPRGFANLFPDGNGDKGIKVKKVKNPGYCDDPGRF